MPGALQSLPGVSNYVTSLAHVLALELGAKRCDSTQPPHRLQDPPHTLHRMSWPLRLRLTYCPACFCNASSLLRLCGVVLFAQLFELPRIRRLLPELPLRTPGVD